MKKYKSTVAVLLLIGTMPFLTGAKAVWTSQQCQDAYTTCKKKCEDKWGSGTVWYDMCKRKCDENLAYCNAER